MINKGWVAEKERVNRKRVLAIQKRESKKANPLKTREKKKKKRERVDVNCREIREREGDR